MLEEMDRLAPLLDGVPVAALVLDGNRKILAANSMLEDMVAQPVVGRRFVRIMRHPDALRLIDKAQKSKERLHAQVSLEFPVPRVLDISAYSLQRTAGFEDLVLITMNDVSPLHEINRTRSSFVANVSHELRSPLATLSGIVETLQGPAREDAKAQDRFLQLMQAEAERMSRLIDDLLSLSKLEARAHLRPTSPVDICAVLSRVTDGFSMRGHGAAHRIHLKCDEKIKQLPGDEDELMQVFQNLVENALKYSGQASPVFVTARKRKRGSEGKWDLVVEVEDQGEGIESHHIPRLTERFYRVDKGRSREMGGTGLGLAITKHIINHHRGSMQIKSKMGEGTKVTVILPGQ